MKGLSAIYWFAVVLPCTSAWAAPIAGTSEITLTESLPCNNSDASEYDCVNYKAVIDADDPSTNLDDALLPSNIILSLRYKKGTPLTNRWVVLDAGGEGPGYGPSFGGVAPGNYSAGGMHGDDLIRWYNERGFITVDVVWFCRTAGPCSADFKVWVPEYAQAGQGWYRNTGGAGYSGIGGRSKAILRWAHANNGGFRVGVHGHSSGSGRWMTVMTRYGGETYIDTVVFDGGPVWAYIPWYCNISKDKTGNVIAMPGPLGPIPANLDISGNSYFWGNYDQARDTNNYEGATRYDYCTNSTWDEGPMLSDSSFLMANPRTFPTTDLHVVLGGRDTSPAPAHARLWFSGYTYQTTSIPALSAKSITLKQGFCDAATGGSYNSFGNSTRPCSDWTPSNFPTVSSTTYISALGSTPHSTASTQAGATELLSSMLSTLELVPSMDGPLPDGGSDAGGGGNGEDGGVRSPGEEPVGTGCGCASADLALPIWAIGLVLARAGRKSRRRAVSGG